MVWNWQHTDNALALNMGWRELIGHNAFTSSKAEQMMLLDTLDT